VSYSAMEVRLCVQNVSNCWLRFCSGDVCVVGCTEVADEMDPLVKSGTNRIIARGGVKVGSPGPDETEVLSLTPLEFVVVAMEVKVSSLMLGAPVVCQSPHILPLPLPRPRRLRLTTAPSFLTQCPSDVFYETDLLARVHSLVLPGLWRRASVARSMTGSTTTAEPVAVGTSPQLCMEAEVVCIEVVVQDEHKFMENFMELPGGIVLRHDWGNTVCDVM